MKIDLSYTRLNGAFTKIDLSYTRLNGPRTKIDLSYTRLNGAFLKVDLLYTRLNGKYRAKAKAKKTVTRFLHIKCPKNALLFAIKYPSFCQNHALPWFFQGSATMCETVK